MQPMYRAARLAAVACFGALLWAAGPAAAAITVTDCGSDAPDVSGLFSPSEACYTLDSGSPGNIGNAALIAALAPYVPGLAYIAKFDPPPGSQNGVAVTGDRKGGDWSLSNAVFGAYSKFVWYFKDGNALPTPHVAYVSTAKSGDWITPFYDNKQGGTCVITGTTIGPFCEAKDVSHVTVFGVPSIVPLPAAGLLLLGALGGLALVRRRSQPAA